MKIDRQWARAGVLCVASLWIYFLPASAQNAAAPIVSAIQAGQFEMAIQQCQAALKATPRDPRLWTLEGIAYDRLNRPQQALAAYDAALKLDPHSLAALEGAAQVEYQQSRSRTISLLSQILAIQPENPTAHAMLAVLQYKNKDYAEAVENFQKSGTIISSQPVALTQYGFSLAQLKRYDEAIPIFERALELQPDSTSLRYDLALNQSRAGHPQEAIETLKPLLNNTSPDEGAVGLGVDIYESESNTPAAVELLRKAIQAEPKNDVNYVAFAMLSYDHGSLQAGVDMINVGLTQIPNDAKLYLTRGILYSELSQFDKAMADFERADQLDPRLPLASTAEGLVHSQEHDLKAAVSSFRAEAKQHPSDALTQYLLAEALSQQGSPVGSPSYREEIEAANRAVTLDPNLAQAHDLLGTVYLQAGKTDLAIQHSRAALHANPNDQAALYHLILALRATSNKDEIPALMKRLAQLRQADQSEARHKNDYRLSIESAPEPGRSGINSETQH